MKKWLLAILLALVGIFAINAQKSPKDLFISYPCKYWVNGERFSFYKDTEQTVSHHLKKAKNVHVFELAEKQEEVSFNVYQTKEGFIVTVNGKSFIYDESQERKQTSEIPADAKELVEWDKKVGYCTALTRDKRLVLIVYEH